MLKKVLSRLFNRTNFIPVPYTAETGSAFRVVIRHNGQELDVTNRNTLVALKPVCVSISDPQSLQFSGYAWLCIECKGKVLGKLKIRFMKELRHEDLVTGIFEVIGSENNVYPSYLKWWSNFYLYMQTAFNTRAYNFVMSVQQLNQLHVYYMLPKPVVLITAAVGDRYDLFPMDILGHASPGIFLLGLRNTSPAIQKIKQSGKLCISGVPLEQKKAAYELGKHHKQGEIQIPDLPFETVRSERFGYPVADFSLNVKEVELLSANGIGSHTLFTCKIIHAYDQNTGAQLAHVPWFFEPVLRKLLLQRN